MTEQEQLTKILSLLDKIDNDVRETSKKLEETNKRFENEHENTKAQFAKWDERYFNLVKEQGQTARTIIIAAASVVVFSPVLGAATELAVKFFSR